MEKITFTQLSVDDLKAIIREELKSYFMANPLNTKGSIPTDDFINIDQAAEFLRITKATIYSKVSRRELPSMKRGKRLFFSKEDLKGYLRKGRRKTNDEIEQEAHTYLTRLGR